jgi:hypothetical protein
MTKPLQQLQNYDTDCVGRSRQSPPLVSVSGHMDQVHNLIIDFLWIHFNISLPSTTISPKWSFLLNFSYQTSVGVSLSRHTCYTPC